MNKLLKILLHPALISLIISSVIFFFLPPYFEKYKIELTEKGFTEKVDGQVYYRDLNGDNIGERVEIFTNMLGNAAIKISTHEKGVVAQRNFNKKLPEFSNRNSFGDFDDNGFEEIYVFTENEDSVFLNGLEQYKNDIIVSNKFIVTINKRGNKIDYSIGWYEPIDLDNDGYKEIIFNISAKFSRQPRKIYAYNIIKDTLIYTTEIGSKIAISEIKDVDNDGNVEIFAASGSPGNYAEDSDFPYYDQSAWLFVFNNKLEFLFEPIEFEGFKSSVYSFAYTLDSIPLIGVMYNYRGDKLKNPAFFLYDFTGKKVNYRLFNKEKSRSCGAKIIDNSLYLFDYYGNTVELDKNLKTVRNRKIPNIHSRPYLIVDLNNDNNDELFFYSYYSGTITITQSDLSYPVSYKLPIIRESIIYSIKQNGKKNTELCIQQGEDLFFLSYSKNILYYFKYVVYLGIYLLTLLLIAIIYKIQKHRIQRKIEIEKRIAELQLKTIKNQVDPHFTFNVINTISSMIYEKDKFDVDSYLTKFSKLIRRTLQSSDKISISLNEEIGFVKDYIDLQKVRFDNKFDYVIKIDSSVDQDVEVPKMVLHTYIENAIKHGLQFFKEKGIIKIDIKNSNKSLQIEIQDNGIGREKAKELKTVGTGNGLKIMEQIYSMYYDLKNKHIKHYITDLYNENNSPTGTIIKIVIPL